MINPQELRIGNLVNVPRADQSPFRIDGFEFLFKDYAKVEMQVHPNVHPLTWELKDLSPIPLSPEWLEKCGFEYIGQTEHVYKKQLGGELQWLVIGKMKKNPQFRMFELHFIDSQGDNAFPLTLRTIEHVHDLQNLYFELTGTELVIDQTKNG